MCGGALGTSAECKIHSTQSPRQLVQCEKKHGRCAAEEEYELHECVCAGVKGVEVGFAL